MNICPRAASKKSFQQFNLQGNLNSPRPTLRGIPAEHPRSKKTPMILVKWLDQFLSKAYFRRKPTYTPEN